MYKLKLKSKYDHDQTRYRKQKKCMTPPKVRQYGICPDNCLPLLMSYQNCLKFKPLRAYLKVLC